MESLSGALVRAEEALRAGGRTGSQAFDALVEALRERLDLGGEPDDAARLAARDVPLDTDDDLLGLAYERFFPDLFKGRHGQFFTPRPIVRLLVARLPIGPGVDVLDPTCGSGGLLVEAARKGAKVRGIEIDPRLARLAEVGLRVAGVDGHVDRADFFGAQAAPADVVVANPPFSVSVRDPAVLARFDLARGQDAVVSDRLFIEALGHWVRPGGHAGVVLPYSVLVNPSASDLRDRLDDGFVRLGTCTLPEGVFRPFGGAAGRACLLWLQRRPAAAAEIPVWADLHDPGYDVRLRRFKPTDSSEIGDLCAGTGWTALTSGGWTPPGRVVVGRPVGELARLRTGRGEGAPCQIADLADADRATGEVRPRPGNSAQARSRVRIESGDVLVARLRPGLGNVALAPSTSDPLVGSPEWIVLEPLEARGWLLHALRTPTWRAGLPRTGGQTRPRTTAEAVLDSQLPWPGDALAARVDALSNRLLRARASLGERLDRLQLAVDQFAAGQLDEAGLEARILTLDDDAPI